MTTRRRRPEAASAAATEYQLPDHPLRLVSWQAENIMGVKAARIDASGKQVVIIAGENEQGKSSLIDALAMAIGGSRGGAWPIDPVRHGARAGSVQVDLDELKIDLEISHQGKRLTVKDASGNKIKSPQELLNKLFCALSFNPLAFASMRPDEQDAELKRIAGIEEEWARLDAEAKRVFDERTEANRDVERFKAQLEGMAHHEDAPEVEVSADKLFAELDELEVERQANESKRQALREVGDAVRHRVKGIRDCELEIEELEKSLAFAREKLATERAEHALSLETEARLAAEVDALVDPDIAAKRSEISHLEDTNRKVRENARRRQTQSVYEELAAESKARTERLTAIKNERLDLLENAKFPIPGLGFSDVGPTYNGVPLKQIAKSALIRLSCAIGFAQNPKLKLLLVKDAAFLGESGMKLIAELAAEHDGQVILERVGTHDPCAIVIENGEVVSDEVAAE